jgi:hypothetical protein
MLALTDSNQTANQVAHHVVKEGGGLEIEDHEIARTRPMSARRMIFTGELA